MVSVQGNVMVGVQGNVMVGVQGNVMVGVQGNVMVSVQGNVGVQGQCYGQCSGQCYDGGMSVFGGNEPQYVFDTRHHVIGLRGQIIDSPHPREYGHGRPELRRPSHAHVGQGVSHDDGLRRLDAERPADEQRVVARRLRFRVWVVAAHQQVDERFRRHFPQALLGRGPGVGRTHRHLHTHVLEQLEQRRRVIQRLHRLPRHAGRVLPHAVHRPVGVRRAHTFLPQTRLQLVPDLRHCGLGHQTRAPLGGGVVVAEVGEDLLTQRQARLLLQSVNRKEARSCKQETESTSAVDHYWRYVTLVYALRCSCPQS